MGLFSIVRVARLQATVSTGALPMLQTLLNVTRQTDLAALVVTRTQEKGGRRMHVVARGAFDRGTSNAASEAADVKQHVFLLASRIATRRGVNPELGGAPIKPLVGETKSGSAQAVPGAVSTGPPPQ